eukprot:8749670-Pyramimonas_sp.AAC.1
MGGEGGVEPPPPASARSGCAGTRGPQRPPRWARCGRTRASRRASTPLPRTTCAPTLRLARAAPHACTPRSCWRMAGSMACQRIASSASSSEPPSARSAQAVRSAAATAAAIACREAPPAAAP